MQIECVIFDLDGVLVSTDALHYEAWRTLAKRHGIPYTPADNRRQRGVSRMESLEIVLEKASRAFSSEEKARMAEEKNEVYTALLGALSPKDLLPGVQQSLGYLQRQGVLVAVGSSSKNTRRIMALTGLSGSIPFVADGNDVSFSKPAPDIFLLAAQKAGTAPAQCLVVEDADAGVQAARAAGMRVLGVGAAAQNSKADFRAVSLAGSGRHWPQWLA